MKRFSKIGIALFALALAGATLVIVQAQRPDPDLWEEPKAPGKHPLAKSEEEKRILEIAKEVPRRANVALRDGRLLRVLTESMGAKNVIEIGTSTGYSGLWFALALRKTGGKLTTFEIEPDVAATARDIFKRAGVDDLITIVVGDAHKTVERLEDPIDLLFLDADKEGYIDYLNKLLPLVRPGGLVVAHNMKFPPPDPDYIEAITTNPELETIFLNMEAAGMAVSLKKH